MALIVKICGLSTEETVDAALEAGADMVGFVLFPPSPRNISLKRAAALAARVRGRAETVALTVDMGLPALGEIAKVMKPDWLQLHGREIPSRVVDIRGLYSGRIMKAVGVRIADDVAKARHYLNVADRILFDAKAPEESDRPGGHGRIFDWRLLQSHPKGEPFMLSGGLDVRNIGDALALTHAAGVDISSGVETAPGKKDPNLIYEFLGTVRRLEAGVDVLGQRARPRERFLS